MTTAELADVTDLSPRTIRRYARKGVLNPTFSPMGAYRFTRDDIDKALIARDRNVRRIELVSPGLLRHLQRRRQRRWESRDVLADRRQMTCQGRRHGDNRGPIRCSRCGFQHWPTDRI